MKNLLSIFENFRMPATEIDQYNIFGRGLLSQKMKTFVDAGKPIEFVLLGFPMKSPNDRDKVLGKLPDLAEEASFTNLAKFNDLIKSEYAPGVNINVVSDGFVFSDIMKVTDNVVIEYEEATIDLAKQAPVKWFDLRDFYGNDIAEARTKVVSQFGISDVELERRIMFDPDVNALHRGMIKFLSLDLTINEYPSKNQLQKDARKVAREMMFRNEAYSSLIKKEFTDQIRLSIHPSQNNGAKYSFQLIPGTKIWTSPWHCALAVDEATGEYETIHKKDALGLGYQITEAHGRPYFFTKPKTIYND